MDTKNNNQPKDTPRPQPKPQPTANPRPQPNNGQTVSKGQGKKK